MSLPSPGGWILLLPLALAPPATAGPCVVPDNGLGTAALPPGCADGYEGFLQITDGLPAGTTIDIDARWHAFFNEVEVPGGLLGGDRQTFDGLLEMQMTGTGALAGFVRLINVSVSNVTDSGARAPGDPVQSFPADLFSMFGEVFGDPDFDVLRVRAGTSFGLPGPGHTTLAEQGPDFNVDSFFDVFYEIEFVGAPGSILEGFGGTTQRQDELRAGVPAPPGGLCLEPDNGFGTVDLPPLCPPGYDGHVSIRDGLPAGTTIESDAVLGSFANRVEVPGGGLGGNEQTFDGLLTLPLTGTGVLAGFNRNLVIPVECVTWSAPRSPGDPVQSFDQELWSLTGTLFGDPDFDILSINAGSFTGAPSPGHTTLTLQPTGGWAVDSFFDVCYEIRFVGAPGSVLEGFAGTTTDCDLFFLGFLPVDSPSPDAGAATLTLLPARPNPFGASPTTIAFRVPEGGGRVALRVFDVRGRLVRTLLDGFARGGPGSARWDGRTDRGDRAAAGVYFYRLETPHGALVKKATLLR